ncbi:MAG: amidase, Asp-tRNAAsn/Glu-tRNAGln amidotransferase subunit [Actinomycetia bacterium]|nr:amidase, Asp-tRNAAsn/Glu-tRNAGln amidotransferase subunit [Actinomycetes bacterium]
MTDLSVLDATAQAELVRNGDASAAELVDGAIERIEKVNGELNAVIHPLYERARTAVRDGLPSGPFTGVPLVVKDLDGTLAGAPYHAGNKALKAANYVAAVTSYIFERLERAGFVIVGKTNTPEFGLMPTTEPQAYGPTHNPWNTAHSPGGSSGGSAAAVASGMVPVGHAGDGGGSIRIPASMCGLFGLKPTRGRVSLGPAEHEAWAGLVMRHVVTRSVRDSAGVLDILQGYATGDWYTAPPPGRAYVAEVGTQPGNLKIGVRTGAPLGLAAVDPECVAAVDAAAMLLESLGHTVVEAAPTALDDGVLLETFTTVMLSSLRADLAEVAERIGRPVTADDMEPSTWANYEAGAVFDAGGYVRALTKMQAWSRRAISWWLDDGFDLLLTPMVAEPPPALGDLTDPATGGSRLLPFAIFAAPFNVTGQPAMSLPLAMSGRGLPVGVQLVGAPYREDVLFRVAAQVEHAQSWADARPPVHA